MKRRFASRKYKPHKFASRRFAGLYNIPPSDFYHTHYFILYGPQDAYDFTVYGPSPQVFSQTIKDLISCQAKSM